jgi:putative serine protease PepD
VIGAVVVAGGSLIAVAAEAPGASAEGGGTAVSAASCDVTSVAGDVLPSVVTVAAQGSAGSGTGSGEVIRSDGYILTNNHVVAPAVGGGGKLSGGNIGLGFAIPVDAAMTIANEIITTGRATHAYFGLQTLPIPEAAAAQAGVPGGLYVAGVVAGGPAATAGLQAGDVITTVAGQPAATNVQLQEQTLTKNPGDTVEIGYVRDGKQATATVTLGAQP